MAFEKITEEDRADKGVTGLATTPNLTPTKLQERFDSLANLAIEKFNKLIDSLGKSSAAGNIGTANGTVQSDLSSLFQKIEGALTRISTAEQNIDDEQDALDKLSSTYYSVDKVPYTLLNLKGRVQQLETDGPVMRNDIDTNTSTLEEQENRITNLEVASGSGETSQGFLNLVARVDQAEEDISSVGNRLDNTNEELNATKEDLNTVSSELMNHIIHLVKIKVSVASWSSDNKYTDFPYKATITNSLIESEHVANVVFDVKQATSGIFAPINYTDSGKMYIYANAIPDSEITIPAIYLTRRCSY